MKQNDNSRNEMPGRRLYGVFSAGVAALVSVSCMIDTENPCSDGQIEATDGSKLCLCPDGHAATPSGCLECVENETPGAEGCDCLPGYERVTPDAICTVLAPPPEDMMTDADAGLGGDMMLTSTMSSTLSSEGLGAPCSSDADCTGPDATSCDLMFSMTCIIVGCDAAANNCPDSLLCCDYSMPDAPFTLCGEMCF